MAAGKGGKKGGGKKKGGGQLRQRAVRDVQLQMQPQLDYNNAQLQQAQENYLRAQQAAQSASGGAYDMIHDASRPQFGRIADEFTANLNALAPEFGGAGAAMPYDQNTIYGERGGTIGMPENEVAAANALGGAIGSGALAGLANDQARWGMSREGAQREAAVFGRNTEAALRQQMLDTIQQHENEQANLMAQQPWQIKSRLDELKDQAIEEQLARSKMRSDRAFSDLLAEQLGMMTSGYGRGGGGRVGGNPMNRGEARGGFGGGPGGGIAGQGPTDTGVGGNRGSSWAGASNMYATPGSVVGAVRNADYVNELPGWVRYAFNRGPGALENPARRKLYKNRLDELLARFRPPEIDIPDPWGY